VVANTGTASGARRLRPLNQPRPVDVETGESNAPAYVSLSGHRCGVEAVLETWRIDDEWWREQPVSRAYWRVLLEDGQTVDVYHDLTRRCWYRQAYSA
jgi:endonuclease/exonuclease/phosphatase (EEP) superfamily protein YafD